MLSPTGGAVLLWLLPLCVPTCRLPEEKGQRGKFIYLELGKMALGVVVYTRAPLEGLIPRGLLKGCYRDQQVTSCWYPPVAFQWVCLPLHSQLQGMPGISPQPFRNWVLPNVHGVGAPTPCSPQGPFACKSQPRAGGLGSGRGQTLRLSLDRTGVERWKGHQGVPRQLATNTANSPP